VGTASFEVAGVAAATRPVVANRAVASRVRRSIVESLGEKPVEGNRVCRCVTMT
jgi:hypothetical protein